jgi:hypothetical protein
MLFHLIAALFPPRAKQRGDPTKTVLVLPREHLILSTPHHTALTGADPFVSRDRLTQRTRTFVGGASP